MKKVIFPSYENMALNAKLEMFVSKINGLEGSAWMKSGAIMKEIFKDWKTNFASSSQTKVWSFWIKQVRRAILIE